MKKKLTLDYIMIQIFFFMMMSVMCGYGAYLLIQIGYSSTSTGILMSLGNILCFVLQAYTAELADNNVKFNVFRVSTIIAIASLVASIIGYFQRNVSLLTSASFVALNGIYSTLEPLNNSIPDKIKQKGLNIEFGVGRAFGSLSYAVTSVIMGFLTSRYPYTVVLVLDVLSSGLMIFAYILVNKHYQSLPDRKVDDVFKDTKISYSQFFKRHVNFALLSVALAGIYFGFTMSDNLIVLVIDNVKGSTKDMGLIMGIKALLEVPVIFFYDKIEEKFSTNTLLIVAAFAFCLKALLLYLANSTTLVYLAQFTQPFALAIMVPAMVSYTNKIMDKKEAVRGQALYTMIIALSSIASSTIGGSLAENYSVSMMLLVAFVVSIVSAIAFALFIKKN